MIPVRGLDTQLLNELKTQSVGIPRDCLQSCGLGRFVKRARRRFPLILLFRPT